MSGRAGPDPRSRAVPVPVVLARLLRRPGPARGRTEEVSVAEALGRVAARSVRARRFLPPTPVATMDGFAVRSGPRAARERARALRVVARSFPGTRSDRLPRVGAEDAVEIYTGAPLPPGANAVVRAEDCRRAGDRVTILRAVAAGRNVAPPGEDFRPGQTIVAEDSCLRPWHVAALVANEISRVRVRRPPRVALLSTGNEIEAGSGRLRPGRTRDSAKPLLRSMLLELGAEPVDLGIVPDRAGPIRRRALAALRTCDALITTGGSSIGARDRVPEAIGGLARVRWIAERLRLRPGSSTRVATVGRRPVFVLSGPPVAAYAGFVALVAPFLRALGGVERSVPPPVAAMLAEAIPHAPGVRELVRVRLSAARPVARASVVERHGAGRLSSLTGADGLLVLDERRGRYRKGERVDVTLL